MLSDSISDRTIVLLLLFVPSRKFFGLPYSYKTNAPLVQSIRTNKANVPADLQSAEIEYKDFNPITSYFLLIGMSCGSKILIFYAVG